MRNRPVDGSSSESPVRSLIVIGRRKASIPDCALAPHRTPAAPSPSIPSSTRRPTGRSSGGHDSSAGTPGSTMTRVRGRWAARMARDAPRQASYGCGSVVDMGHETDVEAALEALDLARRRFVNVVGHELRTPVTTLRGLAEELPDATLEEVHELA